jgi:hypothetical protein
MRDFVSRTPRSFSATIPSPKKNDAIKRLRWLSHVHIPPTCIGHHGFLTMASS